jgi:bacteriocin-like protein
MSKDQGKSKSKPEQKHTSPAKDRKKIDPTELSEDDLNKVTGGTGSPTPSEIKYFYKEGT